MFAKFAIISRATLDGLGRREMNKTSPRAIATICDCVRKKAVAKSKDTEAGAVSAQGPPEASAGGATRSSQPAPPSQQPAGSTDGSLHIGTSAPFADFFSLDSLFPLCSSFHPGHSYQGKCYFLHIGVYLKIPK